MSDIAAQARALDIFEEQAPPATRVRGYWQSVGYRLRHDPVTLAFGAVILLIVLAAVLLAGLTSAPRQSFWRDSASAPYLVQAAQALKPLLPQTFSERLRYD